MEEVKVGSMYGVSYVQQLRETLRKLQEHLRDKTAECEELNDQLTKTHRAFEECEGYKRELLDLTSHHADLSRSCCKDYKITIEKNRKLKKRLRKREEQLKKVGSILNTMETMFNIRGE